MKIKTASFILSLFMVLIMAINVKSQISVSNVSEIQRVKKGTTYIVMKNPDSEKSKEFREVFQKYWTFSKFQFIKFSDIDKYYGEESSFLDIRGYKSTGSYQTVSERSNSLKGDREYSNTYFYLELWVCTEKCLKSKIKNKMDLDHYKQFIIKIELGTDQEMIDKPDNLYQSDYDGKEHIQNWGPGILKNYIQLITYSLNKGEENHYLIDLVNESELKNLKHETLYIPEYVLLKYNYNPLDNRNVRDEAEVLGDYKLSYKVITKGELNNKILTETEPFYYLLYANGSANRLVSIVNSKTGEFIYNSATTGINKFKSGDMKEIYKDVMKK